MEVGKPDYRPCQQTAIPAEDPIESEKVLRRTPYFSLSIRVGAEHLSRADRVETNPHRLAYRIFHESHRTVSQQCVHAAGVTAP